MIACKDIICHLERMAPPEMAEDWDNIGLLLGSAENAIQKVMLCMDITSASLERAKLEGASMIVTHHPVIFKKIKRITEDDPKGRLLYELIRNGIQVYAAHTNLDFAEAGVNFRLAEALGLASPEVLGNGPGKTGYLVHKTDMAGFIRLVKAALKVPHVRVVGRTDKEIYKVAVFSGSFDDDLEAVVRSGADVLVTGDLKYHTALDAAEAGICIVDAGHFHTERIVLPWLADALRNEFPDLEVFFFQEEEDPFKTY